MDVVAESGGSAFVIRGEGLKAEALALSMAEVAVGEVPADESLGLDSDRRRDDPAGKVGVSAPEEGIGD